MRCAHPYSMAVLQIGMRWLVVKAELMLSYQYHRMQREEGFQPMVERMQQEQDAVISMQYLIPPLMFVSGAPLESPINPPALRLTKQHKPHAFADPDIQVTGSSLAAAYLWTLAALHNLLHVPTGQVGQLPNQFSLPLAVKQVVQATTPPTPPSFVEKVVNPTQEGKGNQGAGQGQEEGQGFGSPAGSEPSNNPFTVYIRSSNICITYLIIPGNPHLMEAIVQTIIDPEAPPLSMYGLNTIGEMLVYI